MEADLPKLIYDLALILVLAGVVTIVFKKLHQPLVLGYIVAGFLASPYMPYTLTVGDTASVKLWSELGVIFLMFSLGLEFSFKKILKNGLSPILTAVCIMCGMMALGCAVGKLLHFNSINCLYLGGMLSVSSTTIIYKAYADMGLSNKQFAGHVIAVLILEDIFAIVLMAFLSSFANGAEYKPADAVFIIARLVFFLLLWFVVGIWLIPTLLRRYSVYINKETLLIVSVGLCFLMVVIAHQLGYGAELGAFVMGSILAETLEAERIDSSISSIKDLFGAVFFVSVGMMVQPSQVISHWSFILLLVVTVVVGDIIFGLISFLLSGSSLRDALQSSFSLVQIGEFSFIIASMGAVSGAVEDFVYPSIVAVSIITTFITPYSISFATKLRLPSRSRGKNREKLSSVFSPSFGISHAWRVFLLSCAIYTVVYGILCMSVIRLLFVSLLLLCRSLFTHWPGNAVCGVLTLFLLSIFLRPMVLGGVGTPQALAVSHQGKWNHAFFTLVQVLRFVVAVMVVYYLFNYLSPFWWELHVVLSVLVVILILKSSYIKKLSQRMESTFLFNLTRREEVLPKEGEQMAYARRLQSRDLHVTQLRLPSHTLWAGKTLSQLAVGVKSGVIVTAIIRDYERFNIPGGDTMLFPHDVVEVAGDDASIGEFKQLMEAEVDKELRSGRGIMQIKRMPVGSASVFCGLPISGSRIREDFRCLVIGQEEADGTLSLVSATHLIQSGDVLWIAGEYDDVNNLKPLFLKKKP